MIIRWHRESILNSPLIPRDFDFFYEALNKRLSFRKFATDGPIIIMYIEKLILTIMRPSAISLLLKANLDQGAYYYLILDDTLCGQGAACADVSCLLPLYVRRKFRFSPLQEQ